MANERPENCSTGFISSVYPMGRSPMQASMSGIIFILYNAFSITTDELNVKWD